MALSVFVVETDCMELVEKRISSVLLYKEGSMKVAVVVSALIAIY